MALFASGAFQRISPHELRAWIQDAGFWGPLLFLAAFALLQPFGLSAHAFIIAASLLWAPLPALALCWVGALVATSISYSFARYVGQEWVQRRLPHKLRAYDDRLATRGFRTVILLRLFFFTFAPLQLMFGVSQVRFRDVMAGTAVGLLPLMTVEVFVGDNVFALLTG